MSFPEPKAGISALLTLYDGVIARHFSAALKSLSAQTRPADQVVLVIDGPIRNELQDLVDSFAEELKFCTVVLEQNRGRGGASAAGMKRCEYDLIARVDADDTSTPDRFFKQEKFLRNRPDIDAVGAAIRFVDGDGNDTIKREMRLPSDPDELGKFARRRMPITHPTAMLRASAIAKAGGYLPDHFSEDYELVARMVMSGARLTNMPETLLHHTIDQGSLIRRSGWNKFVEEVRLQAKFRRIGFVSNKQYVINLLLRAAPRLLPNKLIDYAVKKMRGTQLKTEATTLNVHGAQKTE